MLPRFEFLWVKVEKVRHYHFLWSSIESYITPLWCILSSVQFSHSVVSDSLRSHEPQHARPPCPSPTPGVHPDLCPSSRWCHPTISSSVILFSSCPQSLPASESFPMSQLFELCLCVLLSLVSLVPWLQWDLRLGRLRENNVSPANSGQWPKVWVTYWRHTWNPRSWNKSLHLALAKGAFLFKNLTPLTILLGEYITLPSISGTVSSLMDGTVSK